MTSAFKRSLALLAPILALLVQPAYADSLLQLQLRKSNQLGQAARQKQQDLDEKLKEDKKQAEEKAAELAEKAKEALEQDAAQSLEKLKQDLIDGKAILMEAMGCTFKRSFNGISVYGEFTVDQSQEHPIINLAPLFPNDPERAHEAVAFHISAQDGGLSDLTLVDMNDGESKVLRTGKNLNDLGLQDVEAECKPGKRKLVYLDKSAEQAEADLGKSVKYTAVETGHDAKNDLKDILHLDGK